MIEFSTVLITVALVAILFFLVGYALAWDRYRKEKTVMLRQSKTSTKGIISEQMSPLFPGFPGEASEARFIGKPVDFLIFKGMNEENITEVVFVEVKTGKYPKLNKNEQTLKATIEAKRVRWEEYKKQD